MTGRFSATSRPSKGTVTSASPPDRGSTSAGTRMLDLNFRSSMMAVPKSKVHCCSFRKAIFSSVSAPCSWTAAAFVADASISPSSCASVKPSLVRCTDSRNSPAATGFTSTPKMPGRDGPSVLNDSTLPSVEVRRISTFPLATGLNVSSRVK